MVTTLLGEKGKPPRLVNALKLDRDALLTWDGWTAPARTYLEAMDPQFDLLPVIESYMTKTSQCFNWFTMEVNKRCATIKKEYLTAAEELKDWYQQETGITDEFLNARPPGQGSASQRRGQRQQPKRTTKRHRRKK